MSGFFGLLRVLLTNAELKGEPMADPKPLPPQEAVLPPGMVGVPTQNPPPVQVYRAQSPAVIALKRFLETTAIVLVVSIGSTLPLVTSQLNACQNGVTMATCHMNWSVVMMSFIVAVLSGVTNAFTALAGALHAQFDAGPIPMQLPPVSPPNG